MARLSLRMQADERLAELVGLGSEPAFEAIVHRYRPGLVRHCARVVGHDDADEAVQDALLRAHRSLADGTPVHSLGAWLHAIAHNSALGVLRRRRSAAEYCEVAAPASDAAQSPERDNLDALVSALLSLPVRQRRALVMRELEGRSYGEIAAQLGATEGAVRQLLNRARASIRDRLATLLPLELALRWAALAGGSAPSGAMTLTNGGAFAAKISSAILLSAMPVVAVTTSPPVPPPRPAPSHARPQTTGSAPPRLAADLRNLSGRPHQFGQVLPQVAQVLAQPDPVVGVGSPFDRDKRGRLELGRRGVVRAPNQVGQLSIPRGENARPPLERVSHGIDGSGVAGHLRDGPGGQP